MKKNGKAPLFSKKEWSWIFYDWANSVYATNIMAAIFPTVFVAIAGSQGDQWLGYTVSLSTFIIAILAPILGSYADYKGMKKKLFTFFVLVGVIGTALIACTDNWVYMLVFYGISRIGFSGSGLFYDSFLTDVTPNERMDKVSSWGYAMGYIGGSTSPFIVSIALLLVMGYDSIFAQKFSIIITSVWWIIFTIPFFKNVKQEHYIEKGDKPLRQSFINVGKTFKSICSKKAMLIYIIAYFFYIDGVGTIINISTAYGSVLGLGAVGMILALVVTQLIGMPSAILFNTLANKINARRALILAIIIYFFICLVGFYMGFSLEPHQATLDNQCAETFLPSIAEYAPDALEGNTTDDYKTAYDAYVEDAIAAIKSKDYIAEIGKLTMTTDSTDEKTVQLVATFAPLLQEKALAFITEQKEIIETYHNAVNFSSILFWAMACLVGTVQGGIQAVSRSYFGKLVPKERSGEYFGFFDIFGKFASVMGPLLYAVIASVTGRSSFAVLSLGVLFIIGLIMMVLGGKAMDEATAQTK